MKKSIYKNRIWISVLLFLLACVCIFTACEKEKRDFVELAFPVKLQIENETLTWKAVKNADGYLIDIDGTEYRTETNSLDVFGITNQAKDYQIKVKTLGNQKDTLDSQWSETLFYTLHPTNGLKYKFLNNNHTTEYMVYTENPEEAKGKLVIPATYNSLPVTRVASYGFKDCVYLTGVVLPDSVTTLGENAFRNCIQLKRADLSNIEEILPNAFNGCRNLETTVISENLTTYSLNVFKGCPLLKEIRLPAMVEEIARATEVVEVDFSRFNIAETNPFYKIENDCIIDKRTNAVIYGCETSIIPEGVARIERCAFWDSDIQKVVFPSSVKEIGERAFYNCYQLTEITFSEGLESIGQFAFGLENRTSYAEMRLLFPTTLKTVGRRILDNRHDIECILFSNVESTDYSFSSATVYTDMSYDQNNAWNELGGIVYNCTFKEENGDIYVDSFLYVQTKHFEVKEELGTVHNTILGSVRHADAIDEPKREGYTFVGWSLEEDGEIVIGKWERESIDGVTVYHTLGTNNLKNIPDNTVLYAVWEKNA